MASSRIIEFPGARRRAAIGSPWPSQSERRIKLRYQLDLTVRFHYADTGAPVYGEGLAVNLSSGGVLVASQRQMRVGSLVKLNIEWPFLLEGRIPLQLLAVGHVLRSASSYFAVAFERHEFRTMKSSIQSSAPRATVIRPTTSYGHLTQCGQAPGTETSSSPLVCIP